MSVITRDQFAALRRFNMGHAKADDIATLLVAGLVRPIDGLSLHEQVALVARGEIPLVELTNEGRTATSVPVKFTVTVHIRNEPCREVLVMADTAADAMMVAVKTLDDEGQDPKSVNRIVVEEAHERT